jgi:hypothetical protein
MKDMGKAEIIKKLSEIKKMGFVPTMRVGTTGVGHTLEQLFEIAENNISLPNLKETELKAIREASNSLITLFTGDTNAWDVGGRRANGRAQLAAIEKYGYIDKNGRGAMYHLLECNANSHGLFVAVSDNEIMIKHTDGNLIVKWDLKNVAQKYEEKTKNILLVSAKTCIKNDVEYFYYYRARWCHNGIDHVNIKKLIENNKLLIDLRLHKSINNKGKGVVRNHGTALRIYESDLADLYQTIEELSF